MAGTFRGANPETNPGANAGAGPRTEPGAGTAGAAAAPGARLTFAELDAASDRLAHLLHGIGTSAYGLPGGSGGAENAGSTGGAGGTVAPALPRPPTWSSRCWPCSRRAWSASRSTSATPPPARWPF